jgi:hypothetical protein
MQATGSASNFEPSLIKSFDAREEKNYTFVLSI